MITRFSRVELIRNNGRYRELRYKTERPLTDDLLASICNRLRIHTPEWNKLRQEFEFVDQYWQGSDNMAPVGIRFYDNNGWPIEGFEEEQEQ